MAIKPYHARLSEEYSDRGAYLPTPDQINKATAKIRSTWSDAEYERRAGRDIHQDDGLLASSHLLGRQTKHKAD